MIVLAFFLTASPVLGQRKPPSGGQATVLRDPSPVSELKPNYARRRDARRALNASHARLPALVSQLGKFSKPLQRGRDCISGVRLG
jgi:hypothetical protein